MKKLAVAVMAAGSSSRFGAPKLHADLSGAPLVAWSLRDLEQFDTRYIVSHDSYVLDLAGTRGFVPLVPLATTKSDSLRVAVRAALADAVDMLLCVQGDQALVLPQTKAAFFEKMRQDNVDVIRLRFGEMFCSPMAFSKKMFSRLEKIQGDVGGKALLEALDCSNTCAYVDAKGAFELIDVDLPSDLEKLKSYVGQYQMLSRKEA